MTKVLTEVLAANKAYAENFGDKGKLPLPPGRRFAILTCMDARLDPAKFAGLEEGDAHVIRNAGGVVTDDVLRSLTISQRLLGTEEIVVIMHEDCGLQGSSEDLAAALAVDGTPPPWPVGAFENLEKTLEESLSRLRSSAHLQVRDSIRGFVFDPKGGTLREVGLIQKRHAELGSGERRGGAASADDPRVRRGCADDPAAPPGRGGTAGA